MKITEMQAPEIWEQEPGFVGLCEHIARCAAVCYDSVPKEGGAAVDFVVSLHKRGHGRPLEFGTVAYFDLDDYEDSPWIRQEWTQTLDGYDGPYGESYCAFETNLRLLLDYGHGWKVIEKWADENNLPEWRNRVTIHYPALSRGIADELRTHVTLSSLMRSTRYVDAGKGGEVEFVKPYWYGGGHTDEAFNKACERAEEDYKLLLSLGRKRQEAREVLPLSVKTELVQCGFRDAWMNLIKQRDSEAAHPDARWLAQKIKGLLNIKEDDEEVADV